MIEEKYGYTKKIKEASFDSAIEKVTNAMKEEGFGVITEIDMKGTFQKKLEKDFRNYKILGACNPNLAYEALQTDLSIGLLLPCNVAVYEDDDSSINVSIIKPKEMFRIVDNPAMNETVESVDQKMRNVLSKI